VVESFFDGDLLTKKTNVRTLARGKYLKYPFEFYNLLTRVNPLLVVRIVFDFLMASLIYKFIHVPDDSFESWGIKRFGKTLYNFCFGKYTEKVWGLPARQISPKFATRKIKAIDIKSIISKILGGKGEEHEVYWDEFRYPEKGSGELFRRMADDFVKRGGTLHLNAPVQEIRYDNQSFRSVRFGQRGQESVIEGDFVISTIPIKNLILMMQPSLGDFITYTAKKLKYRALVLVYLIMKTERVSEAHWIYLLDHRFRFNRFTEQKNLSGKTCPKGKTVLCFEICCNTTDPMWNYDDKQCLKMVLEEIEQIEVVDPSLIEDCFVRKFDDAYAVCHLNYEQQVKDVLQRLAEFKNLLSIGRQGLFLQNDMHDSMAMGLSAAEFVMGRREDPLDWYREATAFLDW
jgi:protoporphyrinogen oxidase